MLAHVQHLKKNPNKSDVLWNVGSCKIDCLLESKPLDSHARSMCAKVREVFAFVPLSSV